MESNEPNASVFPRDMDIKYAEVFGYSLDWLPGGPMFRNVDFLAQNRSVVVDREQNAIFHLACCFCGMKSPSGASGMAMHLESAHMRTLEQMPGWSRAETGRMVWEKCVKAQLGGKEMMRFLQPPVAYTAVPGIPSIVFRERDMNFVEIGICQVCGYDVRSIEKKDEEEHIVEACIKHGRDAHPQVLFTENTGVDQKRFDALWPWALEKFCARIWGLKEIVSLLDVACTADAMDCETAKPLPLH